MEINLGPLCFDHLCVVADTVDKVVAGVGPFLCDPLGPWILSKEEERMIFQGVSIPLKMVKPTIVRHVTTAENVEVPSMEELIVGAYVDRHKNQDEEEEGRLLVEMYPNLSGQYVMFWCQ